MAFPFRRAKGLPKPLPKMDAIRNNEQAMPGRVAVVGGGISGLAATFDLAMARAAGQPIEEHLFEGSARLGGVIYTDRAEGCVVEAGPDSFLTEKPQAFELAKELGIAADVIGSNDSARRTYILHRQKLVPLPDGLQFLVPTQLLPMVTTPLIPWGQKLKMLRELFHGTRRAQEETVASFVSRHFGNAMVERIADPLLAGVYGGEAAQLSVQATLPRFVGMEQQHGSLIRAALQARRNARRVPHAPAPRPLFSTLRSGLAQFVEAIQARLEGWEDRPRIRYRTPVAAIQVTERAGRRSYNLVAQGRIFPDFDALVLALPGHETARLIHGVDRELSTPLAAVPYSSSLTVALGYPSHVREQLPPGFGFLVPREEGRRLLACTFVHTKFPTRVPPDRALLRCFLGGSRDEAVLKLDDEQVAALVGEDLKSILGLGEAPLFVRIYRWPRSMPQYTLGHQQRVAAVQQRIRRHPSLFLAGNWESGVGISDCIRSGRAAAAACLRYIRS